ncbi:ABC transporter permease [Rhabdobacter roseus]|uniref:Putative ABC transport system permease protein n=1 Tax=Rhabdobacter roseus TaxID=1655419 RepID=A0A840TWK5_9BACT|nr:ABC transporter permease [Rhabdobacter roseus]MBB5285643.1 putative ABC transport system permease protein [Rhabdobacter roseus]
MIRNYLKIAWRNLIRNKMYSFINVVGLALGITAFLLILEYISFERSYDQFHAQLPHMVRLLNEDVKGQNWPEIEPGWAPRIKERFPEVKDYCRFEYGVSKGVVKTAGGREEPFREKSIGFVEENFFEFFSFPLRVGQPQALAEPNVAFLSGSVARKYFGAKDPLGQVLTLSNQFGTAPFRVEGIYEDMPLNSDIRYDMVFSLATMKSKSYLEGNGWATLDNLDSQYINTFFLLHEGVDLGAFEKKLNTLRTELGPEKDGVKFRLQPFRYTHLAESLSATLHTTGNLKYVYMLGLIALLIILIAWFNYVNLSTAHALRRAGEVGVRKVIGATQRMLMGQFLGESLLVTVLALGVAFLLIQVLQPFFNTLVGKELSLGVLGYTTTWAVGLAILVVGSLGAGAFTAFRLSGFNPMQALKGRLSGSTGGILLRKSLVVVQFTISIVLVLATLVIYSQLRYMKNKNLGIDTERLLVVKGPDVGKDSSYANRKTGFINDITQQGFISDYCVSGSVPSSWFNFATSGFTKPSPRPGDEHKSYSFAIIDNRYLGTYGMTLKAGRNFTSEECNVSWNQNSKVMMNESAIRQLGFVTPEEAIRTRIMWDERPLEIIGVIQDYHHTGVQRAIDPIIFYPQNNNNYYTLRLTSGPLPEKIAAVERLYKGIFPGNPFEYFFVDENFNKQYLSEQEYGQLFTTASLWAILIGCMGLFGLVAFTVEQRTQEIGIRKVLGASVGSIVALLSKDFLLLVLIAIAVASPIAWYLMEQWLQNFANRIDLEWWIFALAALLAITIALLTVGYQSVRAALMNPVKSLRSE